MWRQITINDRKGIEEYLEGLRTIREFYGDKTIKDVEHFVAEKEDCEAWIYDGDGFKCGVAMIYKNGTRRYRVANAWVTGECPIEDAIRLWAEKAVEYCRKRGAKEYEVRVPKDMKNEMGLVTRAKIASSIAQTHRKTELEHENEKEQLVVMTLD